MLGIHIRNINKDISLQSRQATTINPLTSGSRSLRDTHKPFRMAQLPLLISRAKVLISILYLAKSGLRQLFDPAYPFKQKNIGIFMKMVCIISQEVKAKKLTNKGSE